MSTEILTLSPAFKTIEEGISYDTTIFRSGKGKEKAYSHRSRGMRDLTLFLKYQSDTAVKTIWDFYRARKGRYDPFWIKFPTHKKSEGESLGTGDDNETEFALDYFPIDVNSVVPYFDGAAQSSGFTGSNNLTTESSKITFTPAPGAGVVITADYEFYFQVRFMEDRLSRELIMYKLLHMGLKLQEVLWDTYTVPST